MTKRRTYVRKHEGYGLTADGELWKMGRHGYLAGYVSHPDNIATAVDNHEEEMRILRADAMREFGLS